jgi:hypothetical protein
MANELNYYTLLVHLALGEVGEEGAILSK